MNDGVHRSALIVHRYLKCLSAKSRKTFQSSFVIECLPGRM